MKNIIKNSINLLLFPFRIFLPHKILHKIGLTTLKEERINSVLPHCSGYILDIGCGEKNELINKYKANRRHGIGIDIYPWQNVDMVCNSIQLPLKNNCFDTVTIIATLNHVIERKKVLFECFRVLKDEGLLIITMINPVIGFFRHKLTSWWDKDQIIRGMTKGEIYGMRRREIEALFIQTGFTLYKREGIVYGLNNIYIAKKR